MATGTSQALLWFRYRDHFIIQDGLFFKVKGELDAPFYLHEGTFKTRGDAMRWVDSRIDEVDKE